MSDEKPKSLKKKIVYSVLALLVVGGLVGNLMESREAEKMAAEGGFESVQEFEAAKAQNIFTKAEYDAYVAQRDKADKAAAEQGGFLNVDEYRKAQYVNMPTKALYDKYLEQQAELKIAEEKRKAEEAEKARLAAEAEEKQKLLAENAEARELFELTEHISQGGSYAFIEISDINEELFSGKSCSEVLGLRASLKPVKGSHPFGFVVDGTSGKIAEISTEFSFGDDAPTYTMPSACNIFAAPAQVEASCGLDDPKYTQQIYERDESTNIVNKFGRFYCDGCLYESPQEDSDAWTVILNTDEDSLVSPVAKLQTMSIFMNKPYKIDRRAYICRG